MPIPSSAFICLLPLAALHAEGPAVPETPPASEVSVTPSPSQKPPGTSLEKVRMLRAAFPEPFADRKSGV